MISAMDGEDVEPMLSRGKERQRIQLKLICEQEKYLSIILKTTQEQFFKARKTSFWDGDKDTGEWRSDVIQCSPICEIVPYGDRSRQNKITGVIAKLRESSPYFVLEEC